MSYIRNEDGSWARMTGNAIAKAAVTNALGLPMSLGFEFAKIDKDQRQVFGYATVEQPDKQGDIVDFAASVDAFRNWSGNIREQHNKSKAVGICIDWKPIREQKAIWVGCQISRSRDGEDTWTKIQEGVLKGFSIGGVAIESRPQVVKDGGAERTYNRITKYRLDELSIVDNPACPAATVCLVKTLGGGAGAVVTTSVLAPRIAASGGLGDHDALLGQDPANLTNRPPMAGRRRENPNEVPANLVDMDNLVEIMVGPNHFENVVKTGVIRWRKAAETFEGSAAVYKFNRGLAGSPDQYLVKTRDGRHAQYSDWASVRKLGDFRAKTACPSIH